MSLVSCSQSQLEVLNRSPVFAMSLGAKELFHTNFLAFLLEGADPRLEEVRLAIRKALKFSPADGAVSTCVVWREKRNLDLLIVELKQVESPVEQRVEKPALSQKRQDTAPSMGWAWSEDVGWGEHLVDHAVAETASTPALIPTGRVVIVEAKLKSIPREDQLRIYDAALLTNVIVLSYPEDGNGTDWRLTVGGPNGGNTEITRRLLSIDGYDLADWTGVSWRAVQTAIESEAERLNSELEFKHLLGDYATSFGALLAICKRVSTLYMNSRANAKVTYGAVYVQVANAHLQSLRVMDLYSKRLYACWLDDLLNNLVMKLKPAAGWKLEGHVLFTNGVPGLEVKWRNSQWTDFSGQPNELCLGVQIQGTEMRAYVATNTPCPTLEASLEGSGLWQGWFQSQAFGRNWQGLKGNPVALLDEGSGRLTNLKVFNPQKFLYGSTPVGDVPFIELEAEVVRLMGVAHSLTHELE